MLVVSKLSDFYNKTYSAIIWLSNFSNQFLYRIEVFDNFCVLIVLMMKPVD